MGHTEPLTSSRLQGVCTRGGAYRPKYEPNICLSVWIRVDETFGAVTAPRTDIKLGRKALHHTTIPVLSSMTVE